VLLLNNGVRQEGQQWGSEHAPEIDPFVADRFVVLKGAGALRYGSDAIAGAILVEPRALPTDQRFHASLHSGYFTNNRQYVASLMAEQNLPHAPAFSWRAHATYRKGGNARTPDYWLANTGLEEFNYSLALGYRKPRFRTDLFFSAFNTRLGIFMGSHIGNLTDLENAIRSPRPLLNIDRFGYAIGRPSQQVTHLLARSRSTWFLPSASRIVLMAAQQFNRRREYDRALLSDAAELDLEISTTTADLSWEQDPQRPIHATVGVGAMRQENIWSGSRFFIPNFISWNPYAYALRRYTLSRGSAELGIRFDRKAITAYRNRNGAVTSEQRTFANVSGSAGITRRLNDHLKLTGSAALAWRAPGVNELYVNGLHHGAATFEVGDPDLVAEKALNLSVQLRYEADSTWDADLTVYSNRIADFINLVPSGTPTLTLRGAYPTFRFLQTDAWLGGADWRLGRRLTSRWSAHAKGSLLYARDIRKGDWLQQMPANRIEGELTWTIPHKRLRDAYLSPSVTHVARQSRVPRDGTDFLAPPPAYTLLNLEASTTFTLAGHDATLSVGVRNLLDRKYRDYMDRFRYFNDATGRNVQVQLRYRF
jgi:iron complex outermembrane receptor protein